MGSSDAKAAKEAAAKGKAPAPVEQDAGLADDPSASASSDLQKLQAGIWILVSCVYVCFLEFYAAWSTAKGLRLL